ncbi:hypothetical protein EPUS_05623 [Endocarpon pusillum Z07020]|uniref:Nucleolar protein 12 n=1 Tax=Endocarpon pusillum (strain Z07020 / HMAS-L-300199) TaxID=1263415 RepID=U1HHY7_ENDPU|nr:uncharacterized protein EPUS_05623 [Endocarpon pusillum Z07020]ERF68484.1 hypothetical protein EPUS_05623 [Endocarpon pusillum Z07020]
MGKKLEVAPDSSADPSRSADNTLTAPSSALDATLTSLFATSSGPVNVPPVRKARKLQDSNSSRPDTVAIPKDIKGGEDEYPSRSELFRAEFPPDHQAASSTPSDIDEDTLPLPSRKRRRMVLADDVEESFMRRLAHQEARFQSEIDVIRRPVSSSATNTVGPKDPSEQVASEGLEPEDNDHFPRHESLGGVVDGSSIDKSDRTVFLGNVSIEAIKSKSAKKLLLNHLSSCLPQLPSVGVPHKVESLRFRSTAFISGVGPKRAAYAKKELMEETTHSTHAYVVYTTQMAAKKAATSLNGTIVLDRHLRADHVSRPAEIDHRRCVFVGNLGFVDEEIVETETASGVKERKGRGKHPADVEEGLWRSFSNAGKIESVRVIRDKSTRVGKGIAYVQYHDANSVEAALLYNDKKFPPLLPRKLRVTRARKPKEGRKPAHQSKDRSTRSERPGVKWDPRGNGKALQAKGETKGENSEQSSKAKRFVFEGYRATTAGAHNTKASGQKKRKHAVKPTTRSSRRGAAFKAAGGKRQQE